MARKKAEKKKKEKAPKATGEQKSMEFAVAYLQNGGNTQNAAKKVGISRNSAYRIQKTEFFKRYKEKLDREWKERLEQHAIARATDTENPSDTLCIFMLKALDPDRYDDNIRRKKFMDQIVNELEKRLPRINAKIAPKPED